MRIKSLKLSLRQNIALALTLVCAIGLTGAPKSAAQVNLGQAVRDYNAGSYSRALSEFQSLQSSYPTNALVHYYMALCEQSLGHLDQARNQFQWVISSGDARLKVLAQTGFSQLAGKSTQISYSGGSASSAVPSASSSSAAGKVKRVIEFYADW